MGYEYEEFALPSVSPGTRHRIVKHSFGQRLNGKRVYIQAGLHGDEHPGLLVIQHLANELSRLDTAGKIDGEVILVPFANPIGMSQRLFGTILGRFDLENGENFNRGFPNLSQEVEKALNTPFSPNDRKGWKSFFSSVISGLDAISPVSVMKKQLALWAAESDIVLDLHCDTAGIGHVYTTDLQSERAIRLANYLKFKTVILESAGAGGDVFDQVNSGAWYILQKIGIFTPSESGFSATIELRGQLDIDDHLATEDSRGILSFLNDEGVLDFDQSTDGESGAIAYPLEGLIHVPSPVAGIIVYKVKPGDVVNEGDVIAEVVLLDSEEFNDRIPIFSPVNGVIVVRQLQHLVKPGQRAMLIAGYEKHISRVHGKLLLNF